jgi:hypothetical protein
MVIELGWWTVPKIALGAAILGTVLYLLYRS